MSTPTPGQPVWSEQNIRDVTTQVHRYLTEHWIRIDRATVMGALWGSFGAGGALLLGRIIARRDTQRPVDAERGEPR